MSAILIPEVNPQVLKANVTAETRLITAKPCFHFLSIRLLFPQCQRFWLTLPASNSKQVGVFIYEVNQVDCSCFSFLQQSTF